MSEVVEAWQHWQVAYLRLKCEWISWLDLMILIRERVDWRTWCDDTKANILYYLCGVFCFLSFFACIWEKGGKRHRFLTFRPSQSLHFNNRSNSSGPGIVVAGLGMVEDWSGRSRNRLRKLTLVSNCATYPCFSEMVDLGGWRKVESLSTFVFQYGCSSQRKSNG